MLGSATAYRNFVGQIATRARMSAFIADCALAPERPFPAALHDASAAYRGLVAMGHTRIALAGDSAGGGLTLALLRATIGDGGLPRPLCAMVMSPWTDLALTGASMEERATADPLLKRTALADASAMYLGNRSRWTPEASPIDRDLADLPPVLVHAGEDEILLDDSLRYVDRVVASGGSATVHVWAGMAHVFPSSVATLYAAGTALDIAGAFLASATVP